jgi:hypothetical protein
MLIKGWRLSAVHLLEAGPFPAQGSQVNLTLPLRSTNAIETIFSHTSAADTEKEYILGSKIQVSCECRYNRHHSYKTYSTDCQIGSIHTPSHYSHQN